MEAEIQEARERASEKHWIQSGCCSKRGLLIGSRTAIPGRSIFCDFHVQRRDWCRHVSQDEHFIEIEKQQG